MVPISQFPPIRSVIFPDPNIFYTTEEGDSEENHSKRWLGWGNKHRPFPSN